MKIARALGVLALSIAVTGAVVPAAQAEPTARGCGYQGGGKYNHCESNPRLSVMLQVSRFFDSDFKVCVRPGVTDLQPYSPYPRHWAVTGAWYVGGNYCSPGYYGTV
ncbi:DUF6355 family natural product biosynthesis protein [Allokutzneria sp. NRRL B-24872]|uniref:DUF6355 family natural product biosynthesis protein n=1 Tax=Allokutzneria sp. NRRL B-24872 TaxID=1137961 RepID=UPI00117773C6|nr:DUF6355 family natural product biosynthesis protein [Allokutzneria sp. NRRL B-24872]